MEIIGLVGFADSGKGTASKVLIDRGWRPIAFADALKDALAAIFRWPRHLLEGDSPESRVWRETVDTWWAERLSIPNFSPRWAMQNFATDIMRGHFHEDLWVMRVEREILDTDPSFPGIVLTDIRFQNEGALTRRMNGRLFRVRRGPDPVWFSVAKAANDGSEDAVRTMKYAYGSHESEWRWIGMPLDGIIENNGTPEDLRTNLLRMIDR